MGWGLGIGAESAQLSASSTNSDAQGRINFFLSGDQGQCTCREDSFRGCHGIAWHCPADCRSLPAQALLSSAGGFCRAHQHSDGHVVGQCVVVL